MGFLKYIYFSQYYELKQKGKEDKAFLQANVLVATMFLFLAAAFYVFLLFSDSVSHDFDRFIENPAPREIELGLSFLPAN